MSCPTGAGRVGTAPGGPTGPSVPAPGQALSPPAGQPLPQGSCPRAFCPHGTGVTSQNVSAVCSSCRRVGRTCVISLRPSPPRTGQWGARRTLGRCPRALGLPDVGGSQGGGLFLSCLYLPPRVLLEISARTAGSHCGGSWDRLPSPLASMQGGLRGADPGHPGHEALKEKKDARVGGGGGVWEVGRQPESCGRGSAQLVGGFRGSWEAWGSGSHSIWISALRWPGPSSP